MRITTTGVARIIFFESITEQEEEDQVREVLLLPILKLHHPLYPGYQALAGFDLRYTQ